jgi:type IV secretion system protein TrbL
MSVLADIGIGPINIPTPGDVVTALKNAVVDVADAVFDKIIEWIAGLLADAVAKVTEALVTLLDVIRPSLTPGGAIENAATIQQSVLGLAAALVTLFFVFRIIHGLITGQAGQSLRATLVDLPIVIVGTLFFGFLCYTLLAIVDEFSDPLITEYATTLNTTVGELYSQDGIVQGGVFVIIFALLYIIAAVFLCFELFVRSSLIYLVVMFAPLAIATRVWGPTRSYARKATETAVALIFSKLAIAVTLATGASLMSGATESGSNVAMIQGSAILLLAAFMPFALMRVIPMMEGAVAGEGVARTIGMKAVGGAAVAGGAAQMASKPISSLAKRVKGGSSSGGGGDGGESSPAAGPEGGGSAGKGSRGGTGSSPASKSPSSSSSSSGSPPASEPNAASNGDSGPSTPSAPKADTSNAPSSASVTGSEPGKTSAPQASPNFAMPTGSSDSGTAAIGSSSSTVSRAQYRQGSQPTGGSAGTSSDSSAASTGTPIPTGSPSAPGPQPSPTRSNAAQPAEPSGPGAAPSAPSTAMPPPRTSTPTASLAKSRTIARPALQPKPNEDKP